MEPEGQQGPKVYEFTSEPRILSDYESPNNTDSKWTYVAFGDWPQTINAADVTVDRTKSRQMGMFTYYLGSDSNYYVEAKEMALGSGSQYKYSDGTQVGQKGASKKWFKVEPIVWRILNKDYAETGTALLLAENILTGGIKWDDSNNNYKGSNIRKWLNGNSGSKEVSDYKGDAGFLQTAFTETAGNFIAPTIVDNSAQSTLDAAGNLSASKYTCANTKDKIFLLSEQEATKEEYGFAEYDVSGRGNTRIRVTTDYAKATGAYQASEASSGGMWWLRSPSYSFDYSALSINGYGNAYNSASIGATHGGVVPALSISLQWERNS